MPKDRFRAKLNRTRARESLENNPFLLKRIDRARDVAIQIAQQQAKTPPKQTVEEYLAAGGKITKCAPGMASTITTYGPADRRPRR